jgi:hypothetical protein
MFDELLDLADRKINLSSPRRKLLHGSNFRHSRLFSSFTRKDPSCFESASIRIHPRLTCRRAVFDSGSKIRRGELRTSDDRLFASISVHPRLNSPPRALFMPACGELVERSTRAHYSVKLALIFQ